MKNKLCGWVKPTVEQQVRALLRSHPEARVSVLANVVPAPAMDLSASTCSLDQGQLSSCQSNGPAQAAYMAMRTTLTGVVAFVLARLWLYYEIRALEGNIDSDAGGNIGDAFAMLADKGIPNEAVYPYDISKFTQDPGPAVDVAAFDSRGKVGVNYYPITSKGDAFLGDVEKANTSKFGVVFGCLVSEAFCSQMPSGVVRAPGPNDQVAGGHCMTIIGYDHSNRKALVKNSWGDDWGDPACPPGCFWMSYDYLTDPNCGAGDVWIIETLPQGVGQ